MTGMTGGMMVASHEARDACKGEPDLIERIRKAMRAVHDHWMETNETNQFRSALAGVLLETTDDDEKDRVVRSSQALSRMSATIQALQNGVPVDIEAMAAEPVADDIIPLQKLWDETK